MGRQSRVGTRGALGGGWLCISAPLTLISTGPLVEGHRTRDKSRCCQRIYTQFTQLFLDKSCWQPAGGHFSFVCTLLKSFFPTCPTSGGPGVRGRKEGSLQLIGEGAGVAKRASLKSPGEGSHLTIVVLHPCFLGPSPPASVLGTHTHTLSHQCSGEFTFTLMNRFS